MIIIKTDKEIEIMRESGRKLAKVMREVKKEAKPGVTTKELDELAEELILKSGSKTAFKGYGGFPNAMCTSLNEQIVHGVPSNRELIEGDILSLDLGLIHQGFYSDMAITIAIGKIPPEVNRLIRVTKKSLKRAIARLKPGKHLGDISCAIQNYVESQGFQVVRDLCGHGVGRILHEDPQILNFGQRHKGPELKAGMVFAIEPMVVMGKPGIKKGPDGFTYQTADNSLSAHFEHSIAITNNGPIILTE